MKSSHVALLLAVLVNLLILPAAPAKSEGDTLTREGIKAQIEKIEKFISTKQSTVHPSQLQSHWLNLGILYQVLDARFHDGGSYKAPALEAFDNALDFDMDDDTKSHTLYRKGILLRMMSRPEDSVEALEESLSLADTLDRQVNALTALGDSYNMMGNAEHAIKYLNKSITLDKRNFEGYYNLVNILKEQGNETDVHAWEELYVNLKTHIINAKKNHGHEDNSVASGLWAFFIVCIKLGKYDEGWAQLEVAHSMLLKSRNSEDSTPGVIEERSHQIKQVFSKEFFPENVGSKSQTPVFIVGMMRSGSTLVETALDAHPNIYGIGEDSIFNSNLDHIRNEIIAAHSKQQETGDPGVLPEAIIAQAKRVLKLTSTRIKEIADGVSQKGKIKRVVDKMLFNYRNIGFIHLIFPNATILHTVRDPMDTILSCFTHKFDDFGLEWAFDAEALVKQYEQYLTIIAHFKKVISKDRITDINFEKFVREPEATARELVVDKLRLPWDKSVLQFHQLNRSIHTHSINQVRKGIYSSGIGKWRKFAKQLEPIRQMLLPIMKRMKKNNELPFPDEINWLLDPNFPYAEKMSASKSVEAAAVPDKQKQHEDMHERVEKEWQERYGGSTGTENTREQQRIPITKPKRGKIGKILKRRPRRDDEEVDRKFGKCHKVVKVVRGKKMLRSATTTQVPEIHVAEHDGATRQTNQRASFAVLESLLEDLTRDFDADHIITQALPSVRGALQFPSGDTTLDTLAAYGICLFNMGELRRSIDVLEPVLAYQDDFHSASIALASAFALGGELQRAFEVIDSVTKRLPEAEWTTDVCERRAQIANAIERWDEALESLNCAIRLSPKANLYQMRGNVYVKLRFYQRAFTDLKTALSQGDEDKAYGTYILLAKCQNQFGNIKRAIEYLNKGLSIEGLELSHRADLYLELIINYMTVSDISNVYKYLNKLFEIDDRHMMGNGYNGLFHQNMGESSKSIAAYKKVLQENPGEAQSLHFIGLGYFAQGKYQLAMDWFDMLLQADPSHYAWCLKELAWYRWRRMDDPIDSYNPDSEIHWLLKDAWIRRHSKSEYCRGNVCHKNLSLVSQADVEAWKLKSPSATTDMLKFYSKSQIRDFTAAIRMTKSLASWIQVDSPGFLPHKRQHRMFGLVVTQLAELLESHFDMLRGGNVSGLLVSDGAVSKKHLEKVEYFDNYLELKRPKGLTGVHYLGWRDIFDLTVKWRQLAEPHDVVLWIDCTQAQEEGNEKVGLQTFLYHNGKNTRYFPYFKQTMQLLKKIYPYGFYRDDKEPMVMPTKSQVDLVRNSSKLRDVLEATNSFFCMTQIRSIANPMRNLTGTRIAVSQADPEGEALFISTPTDYESKLESFATTMCLDSDNKEGVTYTDGTSLLSNCTSSVDEGVKICLEIFYYWVNFAPLSRGSAATGYSVLMGCMASLGEVPVQPLPSGVQIDWLAILSLSPQEFVSQTYPYVKSRAALSSVLPPCWQRKECPVASLFRTARDIVFAINIDMEEEVDGK